MSLRACDGRSPQAAVASGEKAGEEITEMFWCLKISHVQGSLNSLSGWYATSEHVWHQGFGPAMEQSWCLSGP